MRQTYFIYIIIFCLFASCAPNAYLAKPKNIHTTRYGAYIKVISNKNRIIAKGELIAVTQNGIIITNTLRNFSYSHYIPTTVEIPIDSIDRIKLKVARTSDHPEAISAWASLLCVSTITHGFFAIITLPANFFVGIPIALDASWSTYSFTYPYQISRSDIYKFARYPQGLPKNIDINEIR